MRAEYHDTPGRPGYGSFKISELALPEKPWSAALQRSSDQAWLGADGQWAPEIVFLPLNGNTDKNGDINLNIGPVIVNALDPQEQYRLAVKGIDDNPESDRLRLGAITYSANADLAENPQPAPQSEPIPAIPPAHPSRRKWLASRYMIFLALIAICLAWYFFDPRKEAEEPHLPVPMETPAENQEQQQPLSTEQQVAQFFSSADKSPAMAMELFETVQKKTPAERDAAYRLLYYAASNGNQEGMYKYAECLDPSLPLWGTVQKNGPAAYEYYAKVANSKGARAQLLQWLKEQAAEGNASARLWLREIPQEN